MNEWIKHRGLPFLVLSTFFNNNEVKRKFKLQEMMEEE